MLFEGEKDVDGPDLSFACLAMHVTPVQRTLFNKPVCANNMFVC